MSLLDIQRAKGIVVDKIAEGHTLKDACKSAGVQPGNHYVWKENDVAYREAYEYALRIRNERLEELAEIRVQEGVLEETIYYETDEYGEEVQVSRKQVRKFPEGLHMMLLRAGNPKKFDPRNVKEDKHEDDDLIKILAGARKRLAKAKGEPDGSEESQN